jgi:hypothetical protein
MSENWKGSESELFAEFIEHREVLMIMRKWWRPGYTIVITRLHDDSKFGPENNVVVKIKKFRTNGTGLWEADGVGATLDEAVKKAAETASFRD